jgi:hypothetical protein
MTEDNHEQQQAKADEEAIIKALMESAKQGNIQAIETLGRFKRMDWFARPQPATQAEPVSEATLRRLTDLGERIFSDNVRISLGLAGKLLKLANSASTDERNKAGFVTYDIDHFRRAIEDAEKHAAKPDPERDSK